jgi:Leucine-rich repeat (LRR) protein
MVRQRWVVRAVVVLALVVPAPVGRADEAAAAAAFKKRGATVQRDDRLPGKPITGLNLSGRMMQSTTDADLKALKGFKNLRFLTLYGTKVTDKGMRELKGIKSLEWLHLGETQITDAGLKDLKELSSLRILDLSGTKVTDAGLKQLKQMKNLQSVRLINTKVTDAGVKALRAALPQLNVAI